MITCPLCNKQMNCINHNHLKSHNLDMKEFKKQFPNYETHSEELKLKNKESSKKGIQYSRIVVKTQAEERLVKKIEEFNLLDKKCKQCNEPLIYKIKKADFCNHSCAATYSNTNRKVVYSEIGKANHRHIGLKNKKNLIDGSTRKGIRKFFDLTCCICTKKFQVTYEQKLNKTCSKECKSLLQSQVNHRENNTYGKFGYYQGIYCASSWELAFLIYNKDLGKDIQRCELTFTYFMDDQQHTYFPDFIMDNIIYEVKGYEKEDVQLKTQAVLDASYKIDVIRKKEIMPIIKQLKKKYNVKDITTLYDQKVESNRENIINEELNEIEYLKKQSEDSIAKFKEMFPNGAVIEIGEFLE